MGNVPLRLRESEAIVKVSDLAHYADGWIMAGEIARHSERTLGNRRMIVKNFLWYLHREEFHTCGVAELHAFFVYINRGHTEPGGR